MLRAAQFAARFEYRGHVRGPRGDGLRRHRSLQTVSAERVHDELAKLFVSKQALDWPAPVATTERARLSLAGAR